MKREYMSYEEYLVNVKKGIVTKLPLAGLSILNVVQNP